MLSGVAASMKIERMFASSPYATDRVQKLATQLGCVVGNFTEPYALPKPALLGSPSGAAMILKEFGGRWDRTDRVYYFANWATLEAALSHLVEEREQLAKN